MHVRTGELQVMMNLETLTLLSCFRVSARWTERATSSFFNTGANNCNRRFAAAALISGVLSRYSWVLD